MRAGWFALCLLMLTLFCTGALGEIYCNQAPPEAWDSQEVLRLTVFPTKQSDCMVLEVGGERMFLEGGRDTWHDAITELLQQYNLNSVDYLYVSHGHPDHLDNQMALLESGNLQGALFLTPSTSMPEMEEADVPNRLNALGIPLYIL